MDKLMKLSKKLCAFVLILAICLVPVLSLHTDTVSAATIGTPVIKVSTVYPGYAKVSWGKCSGAAKYSVYRATSKTGTYSKKATVTTTSWSDKTIKDGKTYYYKVKALNKAGTKSSTYSNIKRVSTTLKRPAITLTVKDNDYIRVSWGAVDKANSYAVYRATSKTGTYSYRGTTSNKYFNDKTVKPGKYYYYRVKAIGSDGLYSPFGYYKGQKVAVGTVTGMKLSRPAQGQIKISWDSVPKADKYQVYRSTTGKEGTFTRVYTTKYTSYTNKSLTLGKKYYYKVRAYREVGTEKVYGSFCAAKYLKAISFDPIFQVGAAGAYDSESGKTMVAVYVENSPKCDTLTMEWNSLALQNLDTGKYYYPTDVILLNMDTGKETLQPSTSNISSGTGKVFILYFNEKLSFGNGDKYISYWVKYRGQEGYCMTPVEKA